jgi:hypothetical protein
VVRHPLRKLAIRARRQHQLAPFAFLPEQKRENLFAISQQRYVKVNFVRQRRPNRSLSEPIPAHHSDCS